MYVDLYVIPMLMSEVALDSFCSLSYEAARGPRQTSREGWYFHWYNRKEIVRKHCHSAGAYLSNNYHFKILGFSRRLFVCFIYFSIYNGGGQQPPPDRNNVKITFISVAFALDIVTCSCGELDASTSMVTLKYKVKSSCVLKKDNLAITTRKLKIFVITLRNKQ